jgi:hypothetical protein
MGVHRPLALGLQLERAHMRSPLRSLTLVSGAAALALTGCGLALPRESPQEAAIRRNYHLDDPPPRLFVFAGEIRDFATFRLEPGAGLEFWSEDSEYLPVAELDGQGRYVLRVEACRQDATFGAMVAEKVIFGDNINCTRWIGQFAFRARQGTRCSVSHRSDAKTGGTEPPVLWLLDCQGSVSRSRAWRPVKLAIPAGHP